MTAESITKAAAANTEARTWSEALAEALVDVTRETKLMPSIFLMRVLATADGIAREDVTAAELEALIRDFRTLAAEATAIATALEELREEI